MNDFTKEELLQIQFDVNNGDQLYDEKFSGNSCDILIEKIQFMIDNYCEHEWEYKRQGSIVLGIYCLKCRIKLRGS